MNGIVDSWSHSQIPDDGIFGSELNLDEDDDESIEYLFGSSGYQPDREDQGIICTVCIPHGKASPPSSTVSYPMIHFKG